MKTWIGFLIIFASILVVFITNAQEETQSCSGAMGDVKLSVLSLDSFREVNGTCWRLANGKSMEGTLLNEQPELQHLQGKLPDAEGRFMRIMDHEGKVDPDGKKRNVGSHQKQEIQKHKHGIVRQNYTRHRSGNGGNDRKSITFLSKRTDSGNRPLDNTNDFRDPIDYAGGKETRPVNISLYMYINVGEY